MNDNSRLDGIKQLLGIVLATAVVMVCIFADTLAQMKITEGVREKILISSTVNTKVEVP